eukprot:CAMPEP_0201997582 /NCGR_PEP_ID=MMETSP0905-20130828/4508_1 /ASSEMBLY_ACC=CAM_ASM_000554 /TAXON_ID=420261 /ORGANISM="Thalassiosira antarctica, Strain CCMP982" /LENGTH=691 /DNA_ID=CAMNT_0048553295 /DNA_START=20 /DNA_END=2095 /DNA_ORIENTATION=+
MTSITSLSANPPSFSFPNATPATVHQEAKEIKQKFTQAINSVKQCSSSSNNGGAFAALSLALGEASAASARVTLPSMVHGDADIRAASHAAKDVFKNMFDAALSDEELYKALLVNSNGAGKSSDHEEDTRFQQNILRTLRRNGCGLESKSDQSTVQTKRQQIEETCTAFCAAINEHDEFMLFTEEELEGIDDLDQFSIDGTTGMRKLGLKAPDTMPVLKFAKKSNTRKQVLEALSKKCQVKNTPRFVEVLKLRDGCAKLLGYENHAQYMCETKMVGTPEKAEEFLLELVDVYEPIYKRELELLLDRKRKDVGDSGGGSSVSLDPWDIVYYTRLYKAECAGVDEAALRQYFPLEHVKSTILSIYEELLGLRFERVLDAKVWHEDVECYAVHSVSPEDGSDGVLGHFYLDIFPRKGKYSHQCVYPLQPSYKAGNKRILPACVNIGNLTPSREGSPSLLLFREVETFFHEFGHACHCVLTNSRHSLHSWAWSAVPWPGGVEQDFLEVPSMMLENFVWCPEILRRLSKHVSDGSCLPESTIGALSKSRFLMTGYGKSKYLAMALYDLKVHNGPGPYVFEGKEYDAVSLYNVMIEKYTGIAPMPESFAAASWFHLLMGYDAGYYGYIYSETFAADLFSKFSELSRDNKSVIDAHLGKKYRDTILSPCATVDGDAMLLDFLGREPSKDAFLSRVSMT